MNDVEQEYRKIYHMYDSFTKRIEQLLDTILKGSTIKYHIVESRTKTVESFCEKVGRKKGKYINPLKDITDICALRIIVFYINDLEKIEDLLKENFQIDLANSFNAKNNLTENQFGYLSSHYVVSLKNNRSRLPEWEIYKTIKAEIQVRTVLQHAWAAISHELEYKKTYDIPSVLKRKLFRLAGLIELADEEFQEAKDNHLLVDVAIKNKKSLNDVNVFEEINLDTIQDYIITPNSILDEIEIEAIKAGFTIESEDSSEEGRKYLSDIIELCNIIGISKIVDLEKFVFEFSPLAYNKFYGLYNIIDGEWHVSRGFLVLLALLMSLDRKQLDKYGRTSWGEQIWFKVKRYILKED